MARLPSRDPLGVGGRIVDQKYRVVEAVGEGGFSVVYRAEHMLWKQPVAIKFFKVVPEATSAQRSQLLEGFIQEGRLMAELSSRCASIVQARDVGTLTTPEGLWAPFVVLEWLDGKQLDALLREERDAGRSPRTIEEALALLEPAAIALDVVHAAGIAHRDVKPQNIFVLPMSSRLSSAVACEIQPPVKLLDFGVAKVMAEQEELAQSMFNTGKDITAFTPKYGAPEQFDRSHGPTGPWTDVFAMGLILVELLSGKRALVGGDYVELAAQSRHPTRRPTPRGVGVEVSDAVEAVLDRALAVSPERRFRDIGQMWSALHHAIFPDRPPWTASLRGASALASAPPRAHTSPLVSARTLPEPRTADLGRRRGLAVAGGALLCLCAGGAVAVGVLGRGTPTTPSAAPIAAEALSSPSAAAPRSACPAGMGLVPAGKFFMGSDDPAFELWRPAHKVTLDAFCIDLVEVTVADYRACSDQGECKRADAIPSYPKRDGATDAEHERSRAAYAELCNDGKPGRERHPANCVSWDRAVGYCKFVHKRLPTEAEWEYAARGSDGRPFPWGDEPGDHHRMNACGSECTRWETAHGLEASKRMYDADDGYPGTAPVGAFPDGRTRFGALDVIGNVWEWTADGFAPYGPAEVTNPTGAAGSDRKVIRGGAFNGGVKLWLNAAYRYDQAATASSPAIGFRCAL